MDLTSLVASEIERRLGRPGARTLVAIDGPDAAGKTTLANALVERLSRPVLRASTDAFHRPRAERLSRGPLSVEGCYRDTCDHAALVSELLDPFAAGADSVATGVFDHARDLPARTEATRVPSDAVLVVDGVFLLRPELRDRWDLAVHLHVSAETTIERALGRDAVLMGGEDQVLVRYRERYLPAQELYRSEADPFAHADLVVDATDPSHPVVLAER